MLADEIKGLNHTDLSWVPTSLQIFRICVSHCLIQCAVWMFSTNFIARALNMYTSGQTAICSSDELHHASRWNFAIFWPNVSQCPYPVFRTGFFYFTCCVIVFCVWNYRFQKVYIITVIDCLFVSLCLCFVKIDCHLLTHWLKVSSKTKKDNIPKWMHFRKSSKGLGGSFLIQKITWQTLDLYTGL